MIPSPSGAADVSKQLSKPVRRMLKSEILQRMDHLTIILNRIIIKLRTRQRYYFTGSAHRHFPFPHDPLTQLPFGGRAQPFFVNRSRIISTSIARLEYMRLSRAFSSSRSFMRFTSEASIPPYLLFQL